MTTLRDFLSEVIDEAVILGQESPADLEDQKVDLLDDWLNTIINRLIGGG